MHVSGVCATVVYPFVLRVAGLRLLSVNINIPTKLHIDGEG
jgi:hypothetical protein